MSSSTWKSSRAEELTHVFTLGWVKKLGRVCQMTKAPRRKNSASFYALSMPASSGSQYGIRRSCQECLISHSIVVNGSDRQSDNRRSNPVLSHRRIQRKSIVNI